MKYRISLETAACIKHHISPFPYIELEMNHFILFFYAGRLSFEMY